LREDVTHYLDAVAQALQHGAAELHLGAAAAVLAAVSYMERATILNAGVGAVLADDGSVRLDAGFMDGATRRFGGVADVRRCPTPVRIAAHLVSDGRYGRLLVGEAADSVARVAGIPTCEPSDLITERAVARHRLLVHDSSAPPTDTVGAVAMDAAGRLAAAVSTGGLTGKRAGRVGDSPVVGAGFWADDRYGAAAATGIGEVLLRQGASRRCVELIAAGIDPGAAIQRALAELHDDGDPQADGLGGLIVVTPTGEVALGHDTTEMTAGWIRQGGIPTVSSRWP